MSPRALRWILGLFSSEGQTAAKVLGRDSNGYIGFMNPPAGGGTQAAVKTLSANVTLNDEGDTPITAFTQAMVSGGRYRFTLFIGLTTNTGDQSLYLDRPAGSVINGIYDGSSVINHDFLEMIDANSAAQLQSYTNGGVLITGIVTAADDGDAVWTVIDNGVNTLPEVDSRSWCIWETLYEPA
jgi:hypothetical protein